MIESLDWRHQPNAANMVPTDKMETALENRMEVAYSRVGGEEGGSVR
jgi:hypothetical protein